MASGAISYDAGNVCTQNNSQAWVEGSDGSGIGEYIEIRRKLDVSDNNYGIDYTEICIVNGYIKNEQVWKNNNRVKTLAFYYDDTAITGIIMDFFTPNH